MAETRGRPLGRNGDRSSFDVSRPISRTGAAAITSTFDIHRATPLKYTFSERELGPTWGGRGIRTGTTIN